MKYILMAIVAIGLVGCGGGSGTTYKEGDIVLPEEPTDGTNLIIAADGGSNVGLSYTEIGDGSVLISCGDGDNYDCGINVFEADVIEEEEAEEK